MATYFTSQTMFDLSDLENQAKKWNSIAKDGDDIFVLGDFAKDPISAVEALKVLKGNICCLLGQWDESFMASLGFSISKPKLSVIVFNMLNIPDFNIVLSYWKLADWTNKDLDSICIYGKKEHNNTFVSGKNFCCSLEIWDRLVGIEELLNSIK